MSPKDEQALRDIVAKLEAAWNRGDSVGWTAMFAEDADFIHILGGHFVGQESIERGHRAIFDTVYKGSHNQLTVQKIRAAGTDTAIVFVYGKLKFYDNGAERHLEARPTMVAERINGVWQIVFFQNTLVAQAISAAERDSLTKRVDSEIQARMPNQTNR